MPTPKQQFPAGTPSGGASKAFVNNVRLMIQAQMRTKIRTEQRTGRLNKRALVRPCLPPVDGGAWNAKIFYKREEARKINTAVTVLVDVSGSMSGEKLACASQAACLLTNALAKALRVPTEVIAFSFGRGVQVGIVKAFEHPIASDADIAGGIWTTYRMSHGGNDDANALMFAYKRLLQRKEQKRMLIVLSDGSPADDPNGGDPDNALTQVTDSIRNRKLVELYGIGIMDRNVQRYYGKNAKTVTHLKDLEHVLIDTLRDNVFIEG